MFVATKEDEIMDKQNIQEYTEFYATFMRIKNRDPGQDYTVVLFDGKDKGKQHGKDGTVYN